MTEYTTFTLDGFHNRDLRDWGSDPAYGARIVATAPFIAPGYFPSNGGRYVPPRAYPASRITYTVNWRTACRKHARIHGAAGAWHCDDSLTLFYRDGHRVRVKTFAHAKPA